MFSNPKLSFFAVLLNSVFTLILLSCTTTVSKAQEVKTGDLQPGPIVHDNLSASQIEKIKKIQSTFAEVIPISLEETIANFKRDRNPDNEITIWLVMASAYEKFVSKNPTMDLARKSEVTKVILIRSMASEAETKSQAGLKILTDKEVDEILSYYRLEAKPITVQKN